MKIAFNIHYRTQMGENISVEIDGDNQMVVALSTYNGEFWSGTVDYEMSQPTAVINYRYALYRSEECLRREIGTMAHVVELDDSISSGVVVDDVWRDLPAENFRYSAAFRSQQSVVQVAQPQLKGAKCVTFRVVAPSLNGLRMAVAGDAKSLGEWGARKPLSMREVSDNVWCATMPIKKGEESAEYKFVAIDKSGKITKWESGDNRRISFDWVAPKQNFVMAEAEVRFEGDHIRIAGSAIPVFSLRSEGGCGVGDFGDLKQYVIWAAQTKQKAVQILPINDTTITNTWQDSYPYNSISIYAFHPMYIDLRQLPALKSKVAMGKFERERARLNELSVIDYEAVNQLKRGYVQAVFDQCGAKVLKSAEFKKFYVENCQWLQPYAAFSFMRDESGSANFNLWSRYSVYNKAEIEELCSEQSAEYPKIALYYYMQYLLHIQLLEAANMARSLGVILKGDIPIGISRESVEAWVEPHYFNMNGQAGAPPDAFSVKGQNWGFPTYNWEVMERDNYLWWRRRFAKMAEYFTAYRIDHILGFFRIWEIPQHSVHGLLGQFAPSLPMSASEIEGWGLPFQREFMTQPFINDSMLNEMFGAKSDEVRATYLQHLHHDIYAMREEFATQRMIEAHFAGASDEETLSLKEGLYALISNVLFVADRHDSNMYHPRISVQNDYIFRQLNDREKEAFNRLYNHYYYERHNDFWYHEAMKKLPVLTCSTSMLVCGEDLGMVPDCVAPVMQQLQIISLEIERMPKDPSEEFGHPAWYPYSSVCTIGTHDMATLRGWWREDDVVRDRYYYNELGCGGNVPTDAPGWLCEKVVRRHLDSPSMLVILTWQDWLSMDEKRRNPDIEGERINVPANPRHYWRWRMHISIDELMNQTELNDSIQRMIEISYRG